MTNGDIERLERDRIARERVRTRRWQAVLLCGLLALVAGGCTTVVRNIMRGPKITARVVDAKTGQPIAGAIGLAVCTKFEGPPGLHYAELVDVKEAETDADGRFVIERPHTMVINEESVTVYKFGYVAWNNLYIYPMSETRDSPRIPATIMLERFPVGDSHRRHMTFVSISRRASFYGRERVPKFAQAVQAELSVP